MRRREFVTMAAGAPLLLASAQRSGYSICISREASASERRAASELQHFLERMCGARLAIVTDEKKPEGALILVGRSAVLDSVTRSIPYADLGHEGFALKTVGPHLAIAGGRQRGTMYGVYTFLEKLGCRWYAQDAARIPTMPALRVPPLDETQKPAFEYREIFIREAAGKDWAARNKTNGNFSDLDESTGGKVIYYPFGHSFYSIIPPEKYFSTHPEYFALVNRERVAVRAQLCLSNPDVVRIGIETVLRWAQEHPEASIYSVSSNDADGQCECNECRRIEEEEGAPSGLVVRYVNAIAEAVCRKHPEKLIDTFAYRYCERPPHKTRVHPNVRVRIAPSGACQGHPYEQCPRNRPVMEWLRGWSRVADRLYVWHYITNFFQYLAPFPNLDELAADLVMYRRMGVAGLFLQGAFSAGGGGELAELRSYLLAKLLWNPDLDSKAIIEEFLKAFYDPASQAMGEYVEWMHREVRLPPRGRGSSMYLYRGPTWSKEFVPEARRIFGRMERATAASEFSRRVEKAQLSLDWMELTEAKRFVLKDGSFGPRDPAVFASRCEAFFPKARAHGITHLKEQEGIEATEREYRRAVTPYPPASIENNWLRAVAVPGFHGRVISLVNRKTGREGLRQPAPEIAIGSLDLLGGLLLSVHPEHYSRKQYQIEWQLAGAGGAQELILRGACGNGLRIERTLRLNPERPMLHTVTVVENAGKTRVDAVIESRADVNPGNPDDPAIDFAYKRKDGRMVKEQLLPPLMENYGDVFFRDEQKPDGEWRLINTALGMALINRFPPDQIERCRLWWRGRKQNTISLGLWSPKRTLAPGESLRLEADYLVE